jgi:hypothetical protein
MGALQFSAPSIYQYYWRSIVFHTHDWGGSKPPAGTSTLVQIYIKKVKEMVYPIYVRDAEAVRRLNRVASEQEFSIYISRDNAMTDLRSLLGLFAFLGKECTLIAPDHASPEAFAKALKRMGVLA